MLASLETEKKNKIIELIEKKGFPELKSWLKEKDRKFKKNLGFNLEKKIPMVQRLLLEKVIEKLLPRLARTLEELQIEKLSKSDCQIITELANSFFLREMLPENNFKKWIIKKSIGENSEVKEFLQGKIKIDFCWTSPSSDDHYDCLPLNSDKLFLNILNSFKWKNKEGKVVERLSEEEVKKETSEEIYEFIIALPGFFHKILTEKRINKIKNKLKEKKVETEELRDYFGYKTKNPNDNFVEWEEQMWSGNFPPSVACDTGSYSEVLESIIEYIAERKEFIVKNVVPKMKAEKDSLTKEEIQLVQQEAKDIPYFTEKSFFDPKMGRVGMIIEERKKLKEITREINESLEDLDDENLILLIRRLKRIQRKAKYPLQLHSGKEIELTNFKN